MLSTHSNKRLLTLLNEIHIWLVYERLLIKSLFDNTGHRLLMLMTEHVVHYPLGLGRKDVVGVGITALVARLDAVVKFSRPDNFKFLAREELVYQRLGPDSGILRYIGRVDNALILEYAYNGSIRQYLARQRKPIPLPLKLRWVEQITKVVCFIHSKHVLHGDISCNNIFLDKDLNAKLGDFAGSAIDELPPLICYETSHELPGQDISKKSELFALGSTFYEIMTGSKPCKDLSDQQICDAFTEGRFPNLDSLDVCKKIITRCWTQGYAGADELLEDVKSEGIDFPRLRIYY
jgi:Protein tyrosine and serine/threonine kinase